MPGQAQTLKERKCIQRKMGLEGMSQAQAAAACGVKSQAQASKTGVRLAKKKGGLVKKAKSTKSTKSKSKSKGNKIRTSSDHKFSY